MTTLGGTEPSIPLEANSTCNEHASPFSTHLIPESPKHRLLSAECRDRAPLPGRNGSLQAGVSTPRTSYTGILPPRVPRLHQPETQLRLLLQSNPKPESRRASRSRINRVCRFKESLCMPLLSASPTGQALRGPHAMQGTRAARPGCTPPILHSVRIGSKRGMRGGKVWPWSGDLDPGCFICCV